MLTVKRGIHDNHTYVVKYSLGSRRLLEPNPRKLKPESWLDMVSLAFACSALLPLDEPAEVFL